MKITETSLPGVKLLTAPIFRDSRGAFCETFNLRRIEEGGLPSVWVQDNFSVSAKNVLRGIHYQITHPQGKLVRVTRGAVLDIAVDLRRSSPHFGEHVAVELRGETGEMLWIPPGFGHYYSPDGERTVLWNDPQIGIAWPVNVDDVIVSDKDRAGASLQNADLFD